MNSLIIISDRYKFLHNLFNINKNIDTDILFLNDSTKMTNSHLEELLKHQDKQYKNLLIISDNISVIDNNKYNFMNYVISTESNLYEFDYGVKKLREFFSILKNHNLSSVHIFSLQKSNNIKYILSKIDKELDFPDGIYISNASIFDEDKNIKWSVDWNTKQGYNINKYSYDVFFKSVNNLQYKPLDFYNKITTKNILSVFDIGIFNFSKRYIKLLLNLQVFSPVLSYLSPYFNVVFKLSNSNVLTLPPLKNIVKEQENEKKYYFTLCPHIIRVLYNYNSYSEVLEKEHLNIKNKCKSSTACLLYDENYDSYKDILNILNNNFINPEDKDTLKIIGCGRALSESKLIYIVLQNIITHDVIVNFRGTNTGIELLYDFQATSNLVCDNDIFGTSDIQVHDGIRLYYNSIINNLNNYPEKMSLFSLVKEKLLDDNVKNVIISGHSLGGALSTILCGDLLKNNEQYKHKISLYTYSSISVGNSYLNEYIIKNIKSFNSYRIKQDIVPYLSGDMLDDVKNFESIEERDKREPSLFAFNGEPNLITISSEYNDSILNSDLDPLKKSFYKGIYYTTLHHYIEQYIEDPSYYFKNMHNIETSYKKFINLV